MLESTHTVLYCFGFHFYLASFKILEKKSCFLVIVVAGCKVRADRGKLTNSFY